MKKRFLVIARHEAIQVQMNRAWIAASIFHRNKKISSQ